MSTYSIDQFSKITGLNKILLRTWENRYGFIVPSRTETNLRLYDDNMIVKALNTKILIDNNFKISHIAKMTINQIMSMVNALKNENVVNQHDLSITKTIESGLNFDKELFMFPPFFTCFFYATNQRRRYQQISLPLRQQSLQ